MTDDTREAIVDLALVGVAAVAVYFVAKNPKARRAAWQLVKYGLLTAGPQLLRQEVSRAWSESEGGSANRATGNPTMLR